MIYSNTSICNQAFAILGENAIASLDEDSVRARLANTVYPLTLDFLLFQFDWGFARSFAMLSQLAIDPAKLPLGKYAYALPADVMAVRSLYPYGSRDPWEILGSSLYSVRTENVGIYYTTSEVVEENFSIPFVQALVAGMAYKMAPTLVGAKDMKLATQLYKDFKNQLQESWAADANQSNDYRANDERPELDSFVDPDLAFSSFISNV